MAWYNERCHRQVDGNVNRWRCKGCGLLHFFCVRCKMFKTIPDEWEKSSVWTLNKRMEFLFPEYQRRFGLIQRGWLCDPCWFLIRETLRTVPKTEVEEKVTKPKPVITYVGI